jgi:hypothetical protein
MRGVAKRQRKTQFSYEGFEVWARARTSITGEVVADESSIDESNMPFVINRGHGAPSRVCFGPKPVRSAEDQSMTGGSLRMTSLIGIAQLVTNGR